MAEFAKQLQLRRGTEAEHQSFTGAEAEITYITDKPRLVIHDGMKTGGYKIALLEDLNGYAKSELLNNYRSKEVKLEINDLSEELKTKINEKFNDTELRALISNLESTKLGVVEANSKFRSKETSITLQDLDDSLQQVVSDFNASKEILGNKADRTELDNYRPNSVQINYNDLTSSLQSKIDKIDTQDIAISDLSSSLASLGGRVQDLENGGGSGGNVVADSLWTSEEKTSILADVSALKTASANHVDSSTVTNLENKIIAVETASKTHATVTQFQEVSATAEQNTSDISSLTSKVSALEVKVEGLTPSEGGGDTDISSAEFNALANKVATNEGNISTLSTTYGSISNAINGSGGLNDRVTALESEVGTATANASSALSASESNTQAINQINTKLGSYDSADHDKILSNTSEISKLNTQVETNKDDISEINTKLGSAGSEDSTTVYGKVNNNAKAIEELSTSVDTKFENLEHSTLKNLNTENVRHISQSEYEQMLNIVAMNASLTQALLDIEELKKNKPSEPTTEVYTDITGAERTLKYKLMFTTTGTSVNLYNQNTFKDGGYEELTLEDVFGDYITTENDSDMYKNNNVEVYCYGVSGNPYTTALYLPYSDQSVSVPTESTYLTACDVDPETGSITFSNAGVGGTFLVEVRVYE